MNTLWHGRGLEGLQTKLFRFEKRRARKKLIPKVEFIQIKKKKYTMLDEG